MIEIRFVCNLEKLTPVEKPVIASGDVNSVQIRVEFCQKWDKYAKSAVFFADKNPTPIECPMTADACIVPPEVLAESGTFYVGIRGVVADDTTAAVLTTDVVGYRVVNGAPSGVEIGPTPDVYQQILTGYNKKQNKLAWATDADIEAMFAGTYEGEEDEDPEGNGYLPGDGSPGAVLYTPQTLTEEQKAQARKNIGAVSEESLNEIRTKTIKEQVLGGSKNIFNPDAVVQNKTVDYGGNIVDAANGDMISQTFTVRDGESAITTSYVTGGGTHQLLDFVVTFFDSSMTKITQGSTVRDIPENAKYFIVNIGNIYASALNRIMVQYGNTMTAFESYVEPKIVTIEEVRIKNECLDFAEINKSRNRYNYKTRTDNATMNTDGTTTDSTYRSVSDYIPCNGESVFSVGSGAEGVYCFYDSKKTFISFGVFSNGAEGIAIPATASYVRVSFLKANALTFVLSFTETAMPYEKYGATYTSIESSLDKNSCKAVISDILATGGTIKFLGDSITQGVGGTGFAQDGEEIRDGWNVNTTGYCFANLFKTYIESKYSNSVINYGTRGVRSYNLVSWLEANDGYVTEDDKLLVVMIGTNNKWASTNDTLNDLKNDIQWIVDWCAENDKKLILVSAPMSTVEWDTQYSDGTAVKFHNEDIDHIYKEVAHKNNVDYVPMYQRMVEYCDLKDIDISTIFDDGLHPNDKGYYIMYKILMKELGLAYQMPNSTWDNASPAT